MAIDVCDEPVLLSFFGFHVDDMVLGQLEARLDQLHQQGRRGVEIGSRFPYRFLHSPQLTRFCERVGAHMSLDDDLVTVVLKW